VKKMDKIDGPNADKSEWIKLEILMDPDNTAFASKYSRQFSIFKDGCRVPEEWIKWVMTIPEIENPLYPWRNLLTRPGCFGLC
jgi:hypothetical protein